MTTTDLAHLTQRARITTAALRAACAWSLRSRNLIRSVTEVARMTGVIMAELGPGTGPATPTELVQALRQPLGTLLPQLPDSLQSDQQNIDSTVLLTAEDKLSTAAQELAADSMVSVISGLDPGAEWLPSWAWAQREAIQQQTFGKLIASGDPVAYRIARCALVENPAGVLEEIANAFNQASATRTAEYVALPAGKQFRSGGSAWWWPCPDCKWPMTVEGLIVRCRYPHHQATFLIVEKPRSAPTLTRSNPDGRRVGRPPAAHSSENAVQLDDPIWRFIVVPGCTELRIATVLRRLGAEVDLYPDLDRYDLDISVGEARWDVDVKEHSTAEGLLRHLEEKPVRARYIVVPETHAAQKPILVAALPHHTILTEDDLVRRVTAAVRRERRNAR